MDIVSIVGFVGAAGILIAFFQASRGKWGGASWQFQLVNFMGASALVIYSWVLAAYALVALNTIWVIVAYLGLYKYLRQKG